MQEKINIADLYKSVDGVKYFCDNATLSKYLRKKDNSVVFLQKGVENAYAQVNKADKICTINKNIAIDLGVGAEATRIKICAAFNTLVKTLAKADFTFALVDLGKIAVEKSALDDRKKGGADKISVDDLLDADDDADADADAEK